MFGARKSLRNSRVEVGTATACKYFPGNSAIEFEKMSELHRISQLSGFLSPKPIRLEESSEMVEMSLLPAGTSIRDQYLRYMKSESGAPEIEMRFNECGEALAAIHARMNLPSQTKWLPSVDFRTGLQKAGLTEPDITQRHIPNAYLHGDFSFNNIECAFSSDKLSIFDPSPNYFSTFAADEFGPVYVDIGNFIAVLQGMISPREYRGMKWPRRSQLMDAFIAGYSARSGLNIDRSIGDAFAYASAYAYFSRKFGRVMRYPSLWLLYGGFKG